MSRTTPRERQGYYAHLRKFPPGDFYTHSLLAKLCALIASALSGDPVHPAEYAPWIKWAADLDKAQAAEDQTIMSALDALMDAKLESADG